MYNQQPAALQELHQIREKKSMQWQKMTDQEITKEINTSSAQLLENHNLKEIKIAPGVFKIADK